MRIFFDTEFIEDGETIDLISIGMVRDDGQKFYMENDECDLSQADDWLKEHVIPKLGGARGSRKLIASAIIDFVGEKPEFWAYYADYDWVVLCQLFGRMIDLPEGWPMYCRDLKQEADRLGIRFPEMPEECAHNALEDALWAKSMFRRFIVQDYEPATNGGLKIPVVQK